MVKTIKVWIYKKLSGDNRKESFGVRILTNYQIGRIETQSLNCDCRENISTVIVNLRKKLDNSDILGIIFEPPWEYEITPDGLSTCHCITDNEKFRIMTEYRKIGDRIPQPIS